MDLQTPNPLLINDLLCRSLTWCELGHYLDLEFGPYIVINPPVNALLESARTETHNPVQTPLQMELFSGSRETAA